MIGITVRERKVLRYGSVGVKHHENSKEYIRGKWLRMRIGVGHRAASFSSLYSVDVKKKQNRIKFVISYDS